jgi:hypothetical protein
MTRPDMKLALRPKLAQFRVLRLEGGQRCRFPAEGLYHELAAYGLLHVAVQGAQHLLVAHEIALGALGYGARHDDAERQDNYGYRGQQRAYEEHHGRHAQHGYAGGEHFRKALLQSGGHEIQVIAHPAQDVAMAMPVEPAYGQAVKLGHDAPAQFEGALLGHAGHQVIHQVTKEGAESVERGQAREHPPQEGEVHRAYAGLRGAEQLVYARPMSLGAAMVKAVLKTAMRPDEGYAAGARL